MSVRALALMLVFGSASAAPVPKELKVSTDLQRMRGVWQADGAGGLRWYFEGEKLHVGGQNTTDNKGLTYDFALRPGASPGEIDFGGGVRIQYYAIYRFVGDDLHLAYKGGARPKDFTPRLGEFHDVLKRVPEANK